MTCKTELENPEADITTISADVEYINDIPNPFISRLYKFNVNEAEVITFNIAISTTGDIDMLLQLYIFNEDLEEYIPIGTSILTQLINTIDYDITVGLYAFCLSSTTTPIDYSLSVSFTDFPYIVFPRADISHGSEAVLNFDLVTVLECDNVLKFDLVSGSLPPGLIFHNNGVIEGIIGELDCITNNKYTVGVNSDVTEFEIDFTMGSHSYVYNFNPDDFVWFTGEVVEFELHTNSHSDQDFHMEFGVDVEINLSDTRQYEMYSGAEIGDIYLNTYPRIPTNGSNFNIVDEIPPSFSLVNNDQANEDEFYATQVEWEFVVRVYFEEDPTNYEDRFFKICVSNNWDSDLITFHNAKDNLTTDVFIEEDLLDAESKSDLLEAFSQLETDVSDIPEQPVDFNSLVNEFLDENESGINDGLSDDIVLCEPCVEIELPRIRELDIEGLCVCVIDSDIEIPEAEIEMVAGIQIYCGVEFIENMFTQMACYPIEPCGSEPIYIRTPTYKEEIVFENQCVGDDSDCT